MNKKQKLEKLKLICWDYNIKPEEMLDVIEGKKDKIFIFDKKKILLRMIESFRWYDIVDIINIEMIKELLDDNLLNEIRSKSLRLRYERLKKILSNETLSSSGWYFESDERIKYPLLSNRWYCSK